MAKKAIEEKGLINPRPKRNANDPSKDGGSQSASGEISHLQRTAGNAAIQRFLAQRKEAGAGTVDDETAMNIQRERGAGQAIDSSIAAKAGDIIGDDFSDVRVHTDAKADKISRKLGAQAFTTGKDIFFKEGAYSPHSMDGQKLITHELTHVTQQGGKAPDMQAKLQVNDPHDSFEQEADRVADSVASGGETAAIQRQAMPEEELPMKRADVQRAAMPEEELPMKRADVQRAAMPEEELPMKRADVQRAAMPEEELPMKRDPATNDQQPATSN